MLIKKWLVRIVVAVFVFFLALYLAIWTLSPVVARMFIADFLQSHNLTLAKDSTIRFNPFLSHIRIRDLAINDENITYFRIGKFDAEVDIHRLLSKEIVLSDFLLDGAFLKGEQAGETLIVAGIDLSKLSENTHQEDLIETETGSVTENKKALPYTFLIPQLSVHNFVFDVDVQGDNHRLTLDAFVIENLIFKETSQAALNQDEINSANQDTAQNIINSVVSELSVSSISLMLRDAFVNQQGFQIAFDSYSLTSKDVVLDLIHDNITAQSHINFASDFSTSLSQLNITMEATESSPDAVVLRFADLNLPDFNVSYSEALGVTIPLVEILDLSFSEKFLDVENDASAIALVSLDAVRLMDVKLSETSVAIDQFNLHALNSHVIIAEDKSIATLVNLSSNKTRNEKDIVLIDQAIVDDENALKDTNRLPEQEADTEVDTNNEFAIALNAFELKDGAKIFFNDQSVSPNYKRSFIVEHLKAGPFDNQNITQKSLFTIVAKSDEYSSFDVSGDITPFTEKLNLTTQFTLRELSLPDTSVYIKNALGFELETGHLDTDIEVVVVDDMIDGEVSIHLRGLNMTAADDYQAGSLKDQTSVPLNVALGLLQDKKGNIKLDVPLSGNVDDPSFGLHGFMALVIKKAIVSATQSYLVKTFVPYANVVSVVKTSGEFLLKLRFEDLPYKPGVVDLHPDQLEYVNQFAQLMKDKPKEQIKICGISTPEEIGLPQGQDVTSADGIAKMQKIALDRAKLFKNYVVKQHDIPSSRLLLCNAQIDTKNGALPRITLSI